MQYFLPWSWSYVKRPNVILDVRGAIHQNPSQRNFSVQDRIAQRILCLGKPDRTSRCSHLMVSTSSACHRRMLQSYPSDLGISSGKLRNERSTAQTRRQYHTREEAWGQSQSPLRTRKTRDEMWSVLRQIELHLQLNVVQNNLFNSRCLGFWWNLIMEQ